MARRVTEQEWHETTDLLVGLSLEEMKYIQKYISPIDKESKLIRAKMEDCIDCVETRGKKFSEKLRDTSLYPDLAS